MAKVNLCYFAKRFSVKLLSGLLLNSSQNQSNNLHEVCRNLNKTQLGFKMSCIQKKPYLLLSSINDAGDANKKIH